jgi:predicted permease
MTPEDPSQEDQWQQEQESHLAMRAEWNRRQGMSPQAARRAAVQSFGNQARLAEDVRAVRVPAWFDQLRQDLRYAWRGLRRWPAFSLAAAGALAIGIGASTAVFSFTDRILFRPLPYWNEQELVWFGMTAPFTESEFLLSWDYGFWREKQPVFSAIAAGSGAGDCELALQDPVRLRCAAVDPGFLALFGLSPQLGRDFTVEDDQFGAPPTALVSNHLWRARLGGDTAVLNQTIDLDGRSVRIIGVLPKDFELPNLAEVDILRPHQRDPKERGAGFLNVYGRLKPGMTVIEARTRLEPLFQQSLKTVPPAFVKDVRFLVHPLRERQNRDSGRAAQLLLAAAGLVLLIAIANAANLQLARAAGRRQEFAIRTALGAGSGRLLRQTLTESLLLSLLGGLAGTLLAAGLLRLFAAAAPAGIARLQQASLDGRVLLAALGLTLAAGLLFGLAPVPRRSGTWLRPGLVVLQIALSLVLLAGAGLLLESLWKLSIVPLGIRTEQLLAVQAQLPRQRYPERAQQLAFWESIEERVSRLPGVSRFAVTNSVPPSGQAMAAVYASLEVFGRGKVAADGTGGMVVIRQVTPGYFHTLQIPIRTGRPFTEDDRRRADSVVILDQTLAARLFPNQDPVGQRIKAGDTGWMEVAGVAANVRNAGLTREPDPEFYMVKRHLPADGRLANTLILQANPALAPAIRDTFRQLDPRLTVQIDTLDQRVSGLRTKPRFQTLLLGGFALAGLLLAAIGLYGVMALLVTQRTREIGIRMAIGATPGAIRTLVLRQAAVWLVTGIGAGLAAAAAAKSLIESHLYGTPPTARMPILAAVTALAAAALLAAWLPARRAATLDPLRALQAK